jgi:hypothetical protein
MIETDVEIRRIRPIQTSVGVDRLIPLFSISNEDLPKLPRITLVPYENEDFILVDGHHRVIRYLFTGRILVPSKVLETDEDMEKCRDGAVGLWYLRTIQQVHKEYEEIWKPGCVEHKVYSIQDLLKKHRREIRGLR